MSKFTPALVISFCLLGIFFSSCKTKSEFRREQEYDKFMKEARGERADLESNLEETRAELTRMGGVVEAEAQARRRENDELKKELSVVATRIQALEQRAVAEELAAKQPAPVPEAPKASYELGKRLYDDGKYEEAADVLRTVATTQPRSEDGKRAQFLLAESHFASKDFASAALEYGEYRKNFPKDPQVPNAIFRQALAFKSMGKKQEAKLFFQDLIERFPRSPASAKAKQELKKLK